MPQPLSRFSANVLILIAALIWGCAFVAQQKGMAFVGALTFTGLRFFLGALCVLPLALWEQKKQTSIRLTLSDYRQFILIGIMLFFGAYCQQMGIGITSVTRSGFITALYVPLVPVAGWLIFRIVPPLVALPAIVLCALGVMCITEVFVQKPILNMSLPPSIWLGMNEGDLWVLVSTVFWAVHVTLIDRAMHTKAAPARLAVTQFVVCGLLGTLAAIFQESLLIILSQEILLSVLPFLLFTGMISVGVGFTIQVFAQQYTRANDVAILLSSEFIFAALAAAWWLNEPFGIWQWSGGALILSAILWIQLAPIGASAKTASLH